MGKTGRKQSRMTRDWAFTVDVQRLKNKAEVEEVGFALLGAVLMNDYAVAAMGPVVRYDTVAKKYEMLIAGGAAVTSDTNLELLVLDKIAVKVWFALQRYVPINVHWQLVGYNLSETFTYSRAEFSLCEEAIG